ncbi:unnamed protein product [Echinostoma caproni]|uniref:Uncharacterized protein n=1 Tax=Echinostoma caproni TaxID=27848 RepID=A0A3P8GRQ9_9TREM|nr:unnamed protein product [Echinostoma caproni]
MCSVNFFYVFNRRSPDHSTFGTFRSSTIVSLTLCRPITLVVAKCWDPSPNNYFTVPRQEPVRPIDPRAWVLHTNAMTGAVGPPGSSSGQPFPGPGSPPTAMGMMQGAYLGMVGNSGLAMPSVPPGMPQLMPTPLAALTSLPSSSNMTSKSLPEQAESNEHPGSDSRGYRSGGPGSSGGPTGTGGPGSAKTAGSRSAGEGTGDHGGSGSLLAGGNNTKSTNSLTVTTDMASVVQTSLCKNCEIGQSQRKAEMEHSNVMGTSRKLYNHILVTSGKAFDVSQTI